MKCFTKEDSAHVCVFTPKSLWCKCFEGVEGVISCDRELSLMPVLLFNSVWFLRLSRVGFKFLRREATSFWKFHELLRKKKEIQKFWSCLPLYREKNIYIFLLYGMFPLSRLFQFLIYVKINCSKNDGLDIWQLFLKTII